LPDLLFVLSIHLKVLIELILFFITEPLPLAHEKVLGFILNLNRELELSLGEFPLSFSFSIWCLTPPFYF